VPRTVRGSNRMGDSLPHNLPERTWPEKFFAAGRRSVWYYAVHRLRKVARRTGSYIPPTKCGSDERTKKLTGPAALRLRDNKQASGRQPSWPGPVQRRVGPWALPTDQQPRPQLGADRIDALVRKEPLGFVGLSRLEQAVDLPHERRVILDPHHPVVHVLPNDMPAQADLDAVVRQPRPSQGPLGIPLEVDLGGGELLGPRVVAGEYPRHERGQ